MVRTSKGTRFRTRNVFRKKPRNRGLPPLGRILTNYEQGEKVDIIIEPSVQKGSPHRRFHGKTAKVDSRRGNAYILRVKDGNKFKMVISRPEHLRKHNE